MCFKYTVAILHKKYNSVHVKGRFQLLGKMRPAADMNSVRR